MLAAMPISGVAEEPWQAAWQRSALTVVTLSLAQPGGGRRVPRPRRAHWNLYLLRAGTVDLDLASGRHRLGPGQAMLVPPGTAFTELVQRDAAYAVVDLRVTAPAGGADPLLAIAPTAPVRPHPAPVASALAELVAAWQRMPADPLARLDLRPAAERLLLLVLRAGFASGPPVAAGVPDWLRRLRQEAVHAEHGRPRSVAALAARAGCSASHLAHLWTRHFGAGIASDLRRERLAEAAAQLQADPDLPVVLVARRWGWDDPRHFARDFRRRFGAPPSRWRRGGPGHPGGHDHA
ncbi:MAG: hypothetical protein RLZZ127_1429 [Planctomycetota bacterium]|jgi:AraC-like DNA-binding protein